MARFTITHEINCDTDTFWKTFFDPAFNDRLFLKELQFPKYVVLSQTEDDKSIARTVDGVPKAELPGPVAKLLGNGFGYRETGTFDKASKSWRFAMQPSTMADKMKMEGTLRVEPAGAGKCRRIVDFTVEAKVFGLGGVIEGAAEKNIRDGWDKSALFLNREFAAKP